MKTPSEIWIQIKKGIKPEWKTAFIAAVAMGFLIHMPALLSDIPNHDGLASMYFDQNMITSGRWFLMIACGFSSYYTLPWLIGVLAIFFLALTSAVLAELLDVHHKGVIVLISGLLVVFPSIASTFAYVYTMDGYMLALLLAVLAVLLTKKYRLGYLGGAVCLAFSLGTYQSYLSFTILLSIYSLLICWIDGDNIKKKVKATFNYLLMGLLGLGLYFIVLQVLLKAQGKVLDTYQGISGMGEVEKAGLFSIIKKIYTDFAAFTLKGNVLFHNVFTLAAFLLLVLLTLLTVFSLCRKRKWWKNPWFFLIIAMMLLALPIATNIILIISPEVTYHLLMRYQWVLYLILMTAFVERYGMQVFHGMPKALLSWGLLLGAGVMVFCYGVADNIAYSNLQKRYEKTYAYCVRLLDRIEQTEGYYQGISIAMIGVVGDEQYPVTDITWPVTSNMIGMNGDSLLYTGANYEAFMQHYLGATLNILPVEVMEEIYDSQEYRSMDSFPGADSIRIVDGVMYIKTENIVNEINIDRN